MSHNIMIVVSTTHDKNTQSNPGLSCIKIGTTSVVQPKIPLQAGLVNLDVPNAVMPPFACVRWLNPSKTDIVLP